MRLFTRVLLGALLVGATAGVSRAADTVVSKTIRNSGGSWGGSYQFLFGNASDGTGEAAVVKVSTASLSGTPTKLKITRMRWSCDGMQVSVLFQASSSDRVAILSGNGEFNEEKDGPIIDPQSSGHTGNILFTTHGASVGDGYTIYLEAKPVQ